MDLNMRSNNTDKTKKGQSELGKQIDLQYLARGNAAVRRFQILFKKDLMSFVGHINEVFRPPMSEGLSFKFAPGKRREMMRIMEARVQGPTGWSDFTPRDAQKSMEPDQPQDPGDQHVGQAWRGFAAKASVGFSFREPNSWQSLHIKINDQMCDAHVDRIPFLKLTMPGRPHWDLNPMLNHVAVELLSDKTSFIPFSVTHRNAVGELTSQATVGPWVMVDLPGAEGIGGARVEQGGYKAGVQVVGFFSFLDG